MLILKKSIMDTVKKSIKGTQTEKNLVISYISESTAYTRYIFYAKKANKESFYPVEQIFNDTAANELHHSKVFFNFLEGGTAEVSLTCDAGVIASTAENLATAVSEEQSEGVEQYTEFAKVADEEGFPEIAEHFRSIAKVEMHHKARFQYFLDLINEGKLWKRDKPVTWRCLVCGYEYVGTEPPTVCPGCDHPYQHYVCVGDYDYEG